MATYKIIFRPSTAFADEGTLYIRVIHNRKTKQIHTGHRLSRREWDALAQRPKIHGNPARVKFLSKIHQDLDKAATKISLVITRLEKKGDAFSAAEVVEQYLSAETYGGFISFARVLIEECDRLGKASCAEHYTTTLNSFIRFNRGKEVPFKNFNCSLIKDYEHYLRISGLCPNSSSYYMRKLRAIYNQAVERKLTTQRRPFRNVYTGIARTNKRAISLDIIRTLRSLDLSKKPQAEFARDMFLFSFYTRGMAMVDMTYLEKSSLKNGILTYRRKKTNQYLYIRWEKPMRDIVNRYNDPKSKYLLPLIEEGNGDERRQYLNASHRINSVLKQLGKNIGLAEPLTMYVARHAWASIAHNNNVPISIISQGMGHDSEKTTRIYLASLSGSIIDNANSQILKLLTKSK